MREGDADFISITEACVGDHGCSAGWVPPLWARIAAADAGEGLHWCCSLIVSVAVGEDECFTGEGAVVDQAYRGGVAVGEVGGFRWLINADLEGGGDVVAGRGKNCGVEGRGSRTVIA